MPLVILIIYLLAFHTVLFLGSWKNFPLFLVSLASVCHGKLWLVCTTVWEKTLFSIKKEKIIPFYILNPQGPVSTAHTVWWEMRHEEAPWEKLKEWGTDMFRCMYTCMKFSKNEKASFCCSENILKTETKTN